MIGRAIATHGYSAASAVRPTPDSTINTTFETIREQWISLIEALTPDQISGNTFHVDRGRWVQFRNWAEESGSAAFRRFSIRNTTPREDPGNISNGERDRVAGTAELVVAYPVHWSKYGDEGVRDLEDMIEHDGETIRRTIGHEATTNYVNGQATCSAQFEIEDGENAIFLVFSIDVTYWRDLTAF